MATMSIEFRAIEFASEAEAAQFGADVLKGGTGFAFNLLWSNRVAASRHMTDADWKALQALAYRLGVDIPC